MRVSIAVVILMSIAFGSTGPEKSAGNGPYVVAFEEQSPF